MGLKCQILLKKANQVYTSGKPVEGTLKYITDKPTTFSSIIVFLKGKLVLKKSISDTAPKTEELVSLHKIILKEEKEVEVGVHEHPFEFLLPEDLPSTFKDNMCTVSYKVFAGLKRLRSVSGVSQFEVEIPVYGKVKPHTQPNQNFGLTKCPFPSNKPIDLDIDIEKTFLTAGEDIKMVYTINNEANVPMSGIKTKLVAETIYKYGDKNTKVGRKTVDQSKVKLPGVKENSEVKLSCVVPTLQNLYSIQNSNSIKRNYKLIVTATFPFPHRTVSTEIPVVIEGGKKFLN